MQLPCDTLRKDLLFRLLPTAAIAGQVVDEDGEPLSGVEVEALAKSSRVGVAADVLPITQDLTPVRTDITNDLGQFRLHDLPPGEYLPGNPIAEFAARSLTDFPWKQVGTGGVRDLHQDS